MPNYTFAIGPATSLSQFSHGPFPHLSQALNFIPKGDHNKPVILYELTDGKDPKPYYRWHRGRQQWVFLREDEIPF